MKTLNSLLILLIGCLAFACGNPREDDNGDNNVGTEKEYGEEESIYKDQHDTDIEQLDSADTDTAQVNKEKIQ